MTTCLLPLCRSARNAFDGYIHSMRSATEGSGDNKGLSEKMDSDEKETILDVPSHIRAEETINLSELL